MLVQLPYNTKCRGRSDSGRLDRLGSAAEKPSVGQEPSADAGNWPPQTFVIRATVKGVRPLRRRNQHSKYGVWHLRVALYILIGF